MAENEMFAKLLQAAFVEEIDEEFKEHRLQDGKMVFFVDKCNEELHEIRCLRNDGFAVSRFVGVLEIPESKDQILVMTVTEW